MSLALPHAAAGYSLRLTIGRLSAQVRLEGEIDVAAAPALTKLMISLDQLAFMAVDVDLSAVTFLDSSGAGPLVEAARRRHRSQMPPIAIGECSARARYFLNVAGLGGQPHLDLAVWDRAGREQHDPGQTRQSAPEKRHP